MNKLNSYNKRLLISVLLVSMCLASIPSTRSTSGLVENNDERTLDTILDESSDVLTAAPTPTLTELSSTFSGEVRDLAISGTYLYVAMYSGGLRIFDCSDPSNLVFVGRYINNTLQYVSVTSVTISGSYAYIIDNMYEVLEIVDVSDPTNPTGVGYLSDDGISMENIFISGSYAYVITFSDGLRIFDISDPTTPVEVGDFYDGGYGRDVYVVGSYAYVADGSDGLEIIDISDPTTPVEVGELDQGDSRAVYVSGSYAYVADYHAGLVIIDISNPATPVEVGGLDLGDDFVNIFLSGSNVFLTNSINGLAIIDISNPATPVKLGDYIQAEGLNDVCVSGSYAFVGLHYDYLEILDISNLAAPTKVSQYYCNTFREVIIKDSYAYLRHSYGFIIADISDLANPIEIGSYEADLEDFYLNGSYMFVAVGNAGVDILDISDPANIIVVGNYDTANIGWLNGCTQVIVQGSYVYAGFLQNGLEIIDFSDFNNPVYKGRYCFNLYIVNEIFLFGSELFICYREEFGGDYHLKILDVSNPASATTKMNLPIDGLEVRALFMKHSTLYLYTSNKFQIYDMNPEGINLLCEESTPSFDDIFVNGAYAYSVSGGSDFAVIDISNPANLTTIYTYTKSYYRSIFYDDSYIYIAGNGLSIYHIDFFDTESPVISNIDHIPVTVSDSNEITVRCQVTDDTSVGVALLHYRRNAESWIVAPMLPGLGNYYTYDIGPYTLYDTIQYYITAEDSTGMKWDTDDNDGAYYTFTIVEGDSPVISAVSHSPHNPTVDDEVTISCSVTDDTGIDYVHLFYIVDGDIHYAPLLMNHTTGSTYTATFGPFEINTTIEYYIAAADSSANENYGILDDESFTFKVGVSTSSSPYAFVVVIIAFIGLASIYHKKR